MNLIDVNINIFIIPMKFGLIEGISSRKAAEKLTDPLILPGPQKSMTQEYPAWGKVDLVLPAGQHDRVMVLSTSWKNVMILSYLPKKLRQM